MNIFIQSKLPLKILLVILLLVTAFVFYSCSALDTPGQKYGSGTQLKNNEKLKGVTSSALFDLYNIIIYQNPSQYIDKVISTRGVLVEQPFLKDKDTRFIIQGTNIGYAANFIVYLDRPLYRPANLGDNTPIVNPGTEIRLFGIFTGVEEYIYGDGTTKKLPALKAVAMYRPDDRTYQYPVWIHQAYQ